VSGDHRSGQGQASGQDRGGEPLCRLADIAEGAGKGFTLGRGLARREIFVVRRGAEVFGYVNSCPHLGSPLDFQPDRFVNADGSYIQCHTHGALFEIQTGHCVAGPCAGQALEPVALAVDDTGRVCLLEQAL